MKDRVVCAVFAAVVAFGFGSAFAGVTVSDYIKDGLVGHWDGEFNRGVGEQHDSTPGVEWVDLSGNDQTATAVKGNGERRLEHGRLQVRGHERNRRLEALQGPDADRAVGSLESARVGMRIG